MIANKYMIANNLLSLVSINTTIFPWKLEIAGLIESLQKTGNIKRSSDYFVFIPIKKITVLANEIARVVHL